jgi:hypothetical protein
MFMNGKNLNPLILAPFYPFSFLKDDGYPVPAPLDGYIIFCLFLAWIWGISFASF